MHYETNSSCKCRWRVTATVRSYTEELAALANFYKTSPDLLSVDQIRRYIHQHLIEKKLSKSWMNQSVSALKILFCGVLKREWKPLDIPRPRREKKLPVVLAREEVKKLIDVTTNLKHRAILRSEEHTSELQSHWYISYAVFCLKKKKNIHCHQWNKD